MGTPEFVIFLNGSYGVGKSSTLDHLGDLLAERSVAFSLMDVDWFHRSWPPADDDPENVRTEALNMAAVWRNYRRTGPRQLVVAGVIATQEDRERYRDALGLPVRSVRLRANPAVTEERLRRRYTEHQTHALDWHLRRYAVHGDRLEQADLDEAVIDTDDRDPRAVAETIADHFRIGSPAPTGSAEGAG